MAKKQLLELSTDLASALETLAEKNEKSKSDVIRQALALYFVANEALDKNKKNRRIAIVEGDKIIERYVLA